MQDHERGFSRKIEDYSDKQEKMKDEVGGWTYFSLRRQHVEIDENVFYQM